VDGVKILVEAELDCVIITFLKHGDNLEVVEKNI
jgi:hypothetical protein